MKIVQCFYSLTIGGAEILAIDLLNEMCQQHQVSLIVVNNKWSSELLKELDKRVKVYFINRRPGSCNPLPVLKFYFLLKRLNPDIIHCHEPNMGQLIKVKAGKLVYTIHDTGIPTDLYHYYQGLVAISDAVYNDVAGRYPVPIRKVYNGVNATKFTKRTDYSLHNQSIKLVQVSRVIHEKKGQDILLRALASVRDTYGFQNFTLDFVGIGTSMDYLKELAAELGLAEQVRFTGEKNRAWIFAHLADYHVLVQPSRYEGFGLTILEGFSAGLPVLASNIEGPAEIINQTPQGFLFEKEDVAGCAAQLYKLMQAYNNGEIASLMTENVPITEAKYSIKACATGYLSEYQQVVGQ
jgi:glycosyltransferase involved in cell wall biosynthesis